mgnify:CR=1 FL=1
MINVYDDVYVKNVGLGIIMKVEDIDTFIIRAFDGNFYRVKRKEMTILKWKNCFGLILFFVSVLCF